MNRRLAEAVVATFRDATENVHYARLEVFDERAWLVSYSWLDASGLTLYFLQRIKSLRVGSAIPVKVLQRFDKNAADNRDRTGSMFAEFIKINRIFLDAGLRYVNLKGFTLVPDACLDGTLRCQFDLDFALLRSDVSRCEEILRQHGYWLSGAGVNVREYRTGSRQLPLVRNLYKENSQYCLEIHFVDAIGRNADSGGKLLRTQQRSFNGLTLPVLSDSDRFVAQALHLFKHLRGEWTRISWLLEYATLVAFHRDNNVLWLEVGKISAADSEVRIALGATTLLASRMFGIATVPSVLAWSVESLPATVRLWIERYGVKAVMASFPGTKLYLLLEHVLDEHKASTLRTTCRKLLPLHRPQRIFSSFVGERWPQRIGNGLTQFRYSCFRLWFHSIGGFSYLVETQRWKRSIAREQI